MAVYRKKTVTVEVYEKIEDENAKIDLSVEENVVELIHDTLGEYMHDGNCCHYYKVIDNKDSVPMSMEEYLEHLFTKYKDYSLCVMEEILSEKEFEEYLKKYYDKRYDKFTNNYFFDLKKDYMSVHIESEE